ncbi:MAG: leucyl aminopeptidase family protein [Phycisphaerales bacterium]|nr:leucyl aminopeptidase family protein [Phycisphaerales bacterium]
MFDSIRVGGKDKPSILVLGHFKGEGLDKHSAARDGQGEAAKALTRGEATGDLGAIAESHPGTGFARIVVVGLGEKKSLDLAGLRSVGAALARRLSAVKGGVVLIDLDGPFKARRFKPAEAGEALGEGFGLGAWIDDGFRGSATKKPSRPGVTLCAGDRQVQGGLERGLALAEGANLTRRLSNTPPNIATPAWIAEECRAIAKKAGLKMRVWKGEELEKERFTGLINVGKASENAPCMIRLEYTPAKSKKDARPLVLVGKTMTYDSGGLSLKINNGMKGMKRDKDGGCAVIGAMHLIGTVIKPDRPVVALLACAENSISDEAYRPDDIITYRNGVTVEVTNTDAEGRLVLADALCWACEKENPEAIIDAATLTGGVVVALGKVYAGMFCENDRLRRAVEAASGATGERVWRLPMHAEYRDMMKSPIADILNSNPSREAHPVQGAAFLSYFVNGDTPWCHLDIAGVHAVEGPSGLFAAGPTGWGARLMARVAQGM